MKKRIVAAKARYLALFWHKLYWVKYRFSVWKLRYESILITTVIILAICVSLYFSPVLENVFKQHLSSQGTVAGLRSLFLAIGSALIGVTAIAFLLVIFAMQVNVERMPYGLFRRASADFRIIGAFGCMLFIAIAIACASIITDMSWASNATLASAWGIILFFALCLYTYRRALLLINPRIQIRLLIKDAIQGMRVWARRAKRAAPLFNIGDENKVLLNHDLKRSTYFQANPHWTNEAKQAIQYATSFSRRYSEHGDHEVSQAALNAMVLINQVYIEAKGKTFFAPVPIVDNPLVTDGFINDTLEHLRQNMRVGLARGDEQYIEQNLQTMAKLVQIYIQIDYSNPYASKFHSHLAAVYLSEAVKSVVPYNMEDVLMEGVKLIGQSAHFLIQYDEIDEIAKLSEEIGVIAHAGIINEKFRPVTLVAMEQLAQLSIALIQVKKGDIYFAVGELKGNIKMVVRSFLNVPDAPLHGVHRNFLGPYYSITNSQAFLPWLTELINVLIKNELDEITTKKFAQNIEVWADGLYQSEKELLLLAIEKQSSFTFDIINWITHVAKILLALSNTPACDDHTSKKLRKHARFLICTLSWIPKDEKTVTFVESFQMTETLFEAAIDACQRDCPKFVEAVQKMLISWALEGGRYQTGWAILERSIYGIATLVLKEGDTTAVENIKKKIASGLIQPNVPDQDIRARAAREIRERSANPHIKGHLSSRIDAEMSRVDPEKLSTLLEELANILSPANETGH